MSVKPPFFRLHYITLLLAALLTIAAIAIQFIPFDRFTFRLVPSEPHFLGTSDMVRNYGVPLRYEKLNQFHKVWIYEENAALYAESKQFSLSRPQLVQNQKRVLISEETMKQHAPKLFDLLTWKAVTTVPKFDEKVFVKNALILCGAIAALCLLAEIVLRYRERSAKNPSRAATAALRVSDLHFSLLTALVASLAFAILLWIAIRPRTDETFTVQTLTLSRSSSRTIEIVRKFEVEKGWPWVHFKNKGVDTLSVTLNENSPELKEAERLRLGGIEPSTLAELAPMLLNQLRNRTDMAGITKDPKTQFVRLTQNLLTCLAIAFALGLCAELVQRRSAKSTSLPPHSVHTAS